MRTVLSPTRFTFGSRDLYTPYSSTEVSVVSDTNSIFSYIRIFCDILLGVTQSFFTYTYNFNKKFNKLLVVLKSYYTNNDLYVTIIQDLKDITKSQSFHKENVKT